MKEYLGDGVYATIEHGTIVLTTENGGVEATNKIVLEFEVCSALETYISLHRKELWQ